MLFFMFKYIWQCFKKWLSIKNKTLHIHQDTRQKVSYLQVYTHLLPSENPFGYGQKQNSLSVSCYSLFREEIKKALQQADDEEKKAEEERKERKTKAEARVAKFESLVRTRNLLVRKARKVSTNLSFF